MQLRAKWTAALLVTGAVPLGLFAWTTTRIQKRGLEKAEQALEVAVIDHVSSVVDKKLDDAAEATHRVGRVLTEGSIGSDDARLELAREALARADALSEVAIYAPDGKLLDAIRRSGVTAPNPPEALVEPAATPNTVGRWLPITFNATAPLLRYVEPVFRDGEQRAWVLGTLRSDALPTELEGLSRDRFDGRADGVLLLDGDGAVVAGGGATLPVGTKVLGRDLFAQTTVPPGAFKHPFALAHEFRAESGEAMVGSARSLPRRGWAVVVRRPAEAAYQTLAESRRLLAAAAAAFAVLAVFLGAYLASRTIRPIRALVDLSRAYAQRRFETRSAIHTGDELEGLGTSMMEMADTLSASEKEVLRRAAVEADLSRYLPAEIAKAIASGERDLRLGGERRAITVVFADVVAFTPFAESAPPERVVAFLNELFTVLTEVVFRHGGIVDKFVGDSVMAVFGAPTDQSDHATRALAAAEDMHRFVEASAPAWKESYAFDVKLAIGLSSGEAVVGNLGSETRMEYTAIGDVVNVAARLEALARPGQTLVTEMTMDLAGDEFSFTQLGEQPLRGKRAPVKVAEVT